MASLPLNVRREKYEAVFAFNIPAIIITWGLPVLDGLVDAAKKYGIPVFRTIESTTDIHHALISQLNVVLAPRITRHGVLVEVYGEGVLLVGESGIGKSEAAVELLKRGHRLIADDAVEIRKISGSQLIGTSPELIRNYIELRGIGIVNVAKLFGVGAVKLENEINLVVNIEPWNNQTAYDRLGAEIAYTEMLGVKVPMHTIPVTPGRNLAVILEVAAMNNRQRKMGYNAALELTEQINRSFDANMGK
jgi:HPr kinase/phosphorylase